MLREQMRVKFGASDGYESERRPTGFLARRFPSLFFYLSGLFGPVVWLAYKAAVKKCDEINWEYASAWYADILEETGIHIKVSGMKFIDEVSGPCVFIANHMSTLETFILPAIIRPKKPLTFVVKKSLVKIPFFGPIMRSRDPIVVGRASPRHDLRAVIEGGLERLDKGISIVVFPQSTRSLYFSPEHFNTIGVKLAAKAQVPVIPLALKTDAWGQGAKIKELGKIRPDLPVRFKFGEPMQVAGHGKKEHAAISDFIKTNLARWQKEDGVNQ